MIIKVNTKKYNEKYDLIIDAIEKQAEHKKEEYELILLYKKIQENSEDKELKELLKASFNSTSKMREVTNRPLNSLLLEENYELKEEIAELRKNVKGLEQIEQLQKIFKEEVKENE